MSKNKKRFFENLEEEIYRIKRKRIQNKKKKKYRKIDLFNIDFEEDYGFYHE